ncbi:lipid A-modifier LpxR family protein [Brevundimonas sp.]|uniref:lipid A-modifier LpxR family protein n=1 Tax=Brevundimonas sp. TaxID=1871086 RepID=UPI0035668D0E
MLKTTAISVKTAALLAMACAGVATVATAQEAVRLADPFADGADRPVTVSDLLTRLERDGSVAAFDAPITDIEPRWVASVSRADRAEPRAVAERDVWFSGGGFDDRLRLRTEGSIRRADGAPVPPGPLDRAGWDTEHYDVSYVRGWTETLGQTGSGLDVTLTPHVGVGVGSRGNSTEAGATLRVGRNLDRLVPDGTEAFGERPRWYVYAAGSGRAVGYNFARTRDGDYARSGVSHDSGNFLGDASIGVAMRKGAIQSSVGLIYREIETEGFRAGHGVDTDVSEGVIAFQLSIKPE